MKVVEIECDVENFRNDMKIQTQAFVQHVDRVREQYKQIKFDGTDISHSSIIQAALF